MKNFSQCKSAIFFLLFILTVNQYSQDRSPHNGRVPELNRFPKKLPIHNNINSIQEFTKAYGYSNSDYSTFSVPIPEGSPFTWLNSWYDPSFASCAVRGNEGNYYVVDAGSPNTLWELNPLNGAMTELGPITGIEAGGTVNGIAVNPCQKYYLAACIFGETNNLYCLDLNTLKATLIGSFPDTTGCMIDICISIMGVGYGYDIIDDNAYKFDPLTGVTTLLGPIGFDANYGQGMDIDALTGTIYLSAFNNSTLTGQLRTMDHNTGATTLLIDWGFEQIAPFALDNAFGCQPGAYNPYPANGALNVSINTQFSWYNVPGATYTEIYFGTSPYAMNLVYSGSAITSFDPGTMESNTTYYWRVVVSTSAGTYYGYVWHFKTLPPGWFIQDYFNNGISGWTIVGPNGLTNWTIPWSNNAGGEPPELEFNSSTTFNGDSWIMSKNLANANGQQLEFKFHHYVDWLADPFNIRAGYTTDNGNTWTILWDFPSSGGNVGPDSVTLDFSGRDSMKMGFSFSGFSSNLNGWYIDNVLMYSVLPIEMQSFTANVNNNNIILKWSTATETNNKGFQIQRRTGNGNYNDVAFINGNGTSARLHFYVYTDSKLEDGVYTYRIKQIDFNGSFGYSKTVIVKVSTNNGFELSQNYPNPFNPVTVIGFRLPVSGRITLKVHDVLGREAATLVNEYKPAGKYEVEFNASNLPSGVYFYRIQTGSYNAIRKMILLK